MTFGEAIAALAAGARVQRSGWNGKGMWLGLQRPDPDSKMSLPYLYLVTAGGDLVPWVASQTDVLAEDWQIVVAARGGCERSMTEAVKHVASTDDGRVANNPPQESQVPGDPMRIKYRVLSEGEKLVMGQLKQSFEQMHHGLTRIGSSREMSIAKTKLEESCMWAVKHLTA